MLGLDVSCLRTLSEGNAIHNNVTLVVYELKFDMLLVTSYHFACTIIIDVASTEPWLRVFWAEGLETLQVIEELTIDVHQTSGQS